MTTSSVVAGSYEMYTAIYTIVSHYRVKVSLISALYLALMTYTQVAYLFTIIISSYLQW